MSKFEKELIVNGSLNPSLTLNEILENFSATDWMRAAWSIRVFLDVFEEIQDLPTYDQICEDPERSLKAMWDLRDDVLTEKKGEQIKRHQQEGKDLFAALSVIKTPRVHTLRLFPFQAIGYIGCLSAWNDFNPFTMADVVRRIEALNIRSDFGINNPNTGKEVVTWEIEGDRTMTMRIDAMGTGTKLRVQEEYDPMIRAIMSRAEPNRVRMIEDNYEIFYAMDFF